METVVTKTDEEEISSSRAKLGRGLINFRWNINEISSAGSAVLRHAPKCRGHRMPKIRTKLLWLRLDLELI